MKNIWRICKINLAETFQQESGKKSKKKKSSKPASSKASIIALLVCFVALTYNFYNIGTGMTAAYMAAGCPEVVLHLGYFMMFMLVFSLSIFQVPAYLYGAKDYDALMSMPISHSEIVAGKLMPLYIINFLYSFAFTAGFFAAYGTITGAGIAFYVITFICMIFAQMIPMVAAALIAWLLELVANAFNAKNLVRIISTFLMIIVLIAVMLLIMNGAKFTDITSLKDVITRISSVLVTARFFEGATNGRPIELLWFILISTAVYAVFVLIFSKNYGKMASKRTVFTRKGKYNENDIKTSSCTMSLCKKDMLNILSNTNYFLNSFMGLIIVLVASIALTIWGGKIAEIPANVMLIAFTLAAFGIALTMPNAPAISLEKPYMWLWKSTPVSMRSVIDAKILSAFILSAPAAVLAVIICGIGFKADIGSILLTVLFALSFTIFTDVYSLSVGIKHPKLDWINDVVVIKQSSAVLIVTLADLGISVLAMAAGWAAELLLHIYPYAAAGISVVFLGLSALIYASLLKKGVKRLERMEP